MNRTGDANTRIDVAVVGLGFGREFVPIYASHPNVGRVAIVDPDAELLARVGDEFDIADRFRGLEAFLGTANWDAAHLATPVPRHADHAVAVLDSGRHCACAVPMATSLEDIRRIIAARQASGKTYMMMETAVFGREYLYTQDLHARGELGKLTFFRGVNIQNLDGFPQAYWLGYPPMLYITHALAPILALADTQVRSVLCLGAGRLAADQVGDWNNPYPVELGLFRLDRDDLAAEITMSYFQTARSFQEGFSVYGNAASIEWPPAEDEPVLTYQFSAPTVPGRPGRPVQTARVEAPDRPDLLPPEVARFTRRTGYRPRPDASPVYLGGGHGGSHPHLVHEFVRAALEERPSHVDVVTAANYTAPGICAHESALRHGAEVAVPSFAWSANQTSRARTAPA